jgi:hypothetical protein
MIEWTPFATQNNLPVKGIFLMWNSVLEMPEFMERDWTHIEENGEEIFVYSLNRGEQIMYFDANIFGNYSHFAVINKPEMK